MLKPMALNIEKNLCIRGRRRYADMLIIEVRLKPLSVSIIRMHIPMSIERQEYVIGNTHPW
jgi:hypothetical protein